MSAEDKPILVIGMSHVEAIESALEERESRSIRIINLNKEPDLYNQRTRRIDFSLLPAAPFTHVFVSYAGNYHNIFGLIEHPQKIAVGDAAAGRIPDEDGRWFLPEAMVRAHFAEVLEKAAFELIRDVQAHFAGRRVFCLGSPPPCGDAQHIRTFPGVFRPRVHQGVSPMALRRKLYELQTGLVVETCARLGVPFVAPPEGVADAEGAMKREYWNNDPTHGNARYGRLVLDQIGQRTGAAA